MAPPIVSEYLVNYILNYVGIGYEMKYFICWYGHRPAYGTFELPSHILQYHSPIYWTLLARKKTRSHRKKRLNRHKKMDS